MNWTARAMAAVVARIELFAHCEARAATPEWRTTCRVERNRLEAVLDRLARR